MLGLLTWPSDQQPCNISWSVPLKRMNFNYLCHLCVETWSKYMILFCEVYFLSQSRCNFNVGTTLCWGTVACVRSCWAMMTSPDGNIFRVTDPSCGEFTGHRWIPLTKASGVFFDLRLKKRLLKQSRRHRAHHDVTVMPGDVLSKAVKHG